MKMRILPQDTTGQDDQEDETEQSPSETLQTWRQISKIHENMGHPSNRHAGKSVTSLWSRAPIHPGIRPGTGVVLVKHRNVQLVQS